jgi:hypothetical protein
MMDRQTRKLVPSSGLVDVSVPSGWQVGDEEEVVKGMKRTPWKVVAHTEQGG